MPRTLLYSALRPVSRRSAREPVPMIGRRAVFGGRCWTLRDAFGSQIAEHASEFIDTGYTAIRNPAKEPGLRAAKQLLASLS